MGEPPKLRFPVRCVRTEMTLAERLDRCDLRKIASDLRRFLLIESFQCFIALRSGAEDRAIYAIQPPFFACFLQRRGKVGLPPTMLNGLTLPPPSSVLAMAVFAARLRERAAQATLTPLPPAELLTRRWLRQADKHGDGEQLCRRRQGQALLQS